MKIQCFMIEPVYHATEINHSGNRSIISWKRPDTGEERERPHEFPAGAMWFCPWLEKSVGLKPVESDGVTPAPKRWNLGPDGRILCVRTPGGEWIVDSRASNCTNPMDDEHRCWVRHGEAPNITVDKNGVTCGAGAGSIQCGTYHGFLRDGCLVDG